MIRVLIADDQAIMRRGLRIYLAGEPDIEVVAEAGNGTEAVAQALATTPDVILMDIRMPGGDGLEATRRLHHHLPTAAVVILTTFDLDDYIFQALDSGAVGFLLKDAPPETIIDAIRSVARGDGAVAPEVTRRILSEFSRRQPSPPVTHDGALSPREVEILQALADGLSNAEIADRLFIEITTVKTHLGRMTTKLGLRDRLQLVVWAYRNGIAN